jgi:hypothetical protein
VVKSFNSPLAGKAKIHGRKIGLNLPCVFCESKRQLYHRLWAIDLRGGGGNIIPSLTAFKIDPVSELPYLLFQPLYWAEMPPKSREDRGFLIQISCILHGFMDGNAWD